MKIMEIIEKNEDFEKNVTTLKLLDTTFNKLAKVIGTDPGKDWTTFGAADVLSQEGLVSLNVEQKTFIPKFEAFKTSYNDWVDSTKIQELSQMTHKLEIGDWASQYIIGVTKANYSKVLSDLTKAERSIRECLHVDSINKYKQAQSELKLWSRNRPYCQSVDNLLSGEFECSHALYWNENAVISSRSDIVCSLENNNKHDKKRLICYDFYKLKVGESVRFDLRIQSKGYDFNIWWVLKNNDLGNSDKDGQLIQTSIGGNGYGWNKVRDATTWRYTGTGKGSDYFLSDENINLDWLKDRVIL